MRIQGLFCQDHINSLLIKCVKKTGPYHDKNFVAGMKTKFKEVDDGFMKEEIIDFILVKVERGRERHSRKGEDSGIYFKIQNTMIYDSTKEEYDGYN